MSDEAAPIGVVQGATTEEIQSLFRDFVARLGVSARVVGVVEDDMLTSLADGRQFPLYQDLGACASSCALDPQGLVLAGEAVREGIAAGCDLVVLSKFGKLEAENGSGLMAAFVTAIEAGVPVLTSVAPRFAASWSAFAEPFYTTLAPHPAALDEWWRSVAASHCFDTTKQG